jgi:site-specific DNA-adenine methylase
MLVFPYYGSKHKIAKFYPEPLYETIIEPFAGSAAYSLYKRNLRETVILNDLDARIVRCWEYLKTVDKHDILNIPRLVAGDDIRKVGLSEGQQILMSFYSSFGTAKPCYTVTSWADQYMWRGSWERKKLWIAKALDKIRHWKILKTDYTKLENIEATWFVDPPYKHGGELYVNNNKNIDYQELREWCLSRKGQVIVCENENGKWMDFKPLRHIKGQRIQRWEYVWHKP